MISQQINNDLMLKKIWKKLLAEGKVESNGHLTVFRMTLLYTEVIGKFGAEKAEKLIKQCKYEYI